MRKLIAIVLVGLFSAAIIACGGDSVEPTNTAPPAAVTQAPTEAPATPTSAPTATAAPTNTPVPSPVPTNTPAPTAAPEPTATPAPTPVPTATPEPKPTATPEPAPTEAATAAPTIEPTATPEPTEAPTVGATPEPSIDPAAADLAPLGDNLLWIAHYDNSTQRLSVYDPSGTFSPENVLPPGQEPPDASEISALTNLTSGQIYFLSVEQTQTVDLRGSTFTLNEGVNFVLWR